MPRSVNVNIPHSLGKAAARQRIEEGFDHVRQQMAAGAGGMLSFQDRWEADRLHFEGKGLGQSLTGRLDVREDSVEIQLDLPQILATLAETISSRLRTEGQKLLEKK